MVATAPVTVSVPSGFSVARVRRRKACPDAKAAQADVVAVLVPGTSAPAAVGDSAAVEGAADDAVAASTGLTLAATDTLACGLAADAGAVGAALDEVAAHPALASASPAAKTVVPQAPSVRQVPVIAASPVQS
jgi:hypothetical protein